MWECQIQQFRPYIKESMCRPSIMATEKKPSRAAHSRPKRLGLHNGLETHSAKTHVFANAFLSTCLFTKYQESRLALWLELSNFSPKSIYNFCLLGRPTIHPKMCYPGYFFLGFKIKLDIFVENSQNLIRHIASNAEKN